MRRSSKRSWTRLLPILASLLLLGCGSGIPGGDVKGTGEPEETDIENCYQETLEPGETEDPPLDCPGSGGTGGDDESFGTPAEGEWTGTLTYVWTQRVEETGPGMHSLQEQTYEATVQITSTQVDSFGWELSGQALVRASWLSDFDSQLDTPLGPCHQVYTDLVPKNDPEAVAVSSGGLEAGDAGDLYQFHVSLDGYELVNHTVRDDSGCFGSKTVEDTPWSVAPTSLGGSGTITDPTRLQGTLVKPNPTGDDTLTWDLRLN